MTLGYSESDHQPPESRKQERTVGSDRGALPGLLLVGFPGPPAAPGVRLSSHRALHVSCPLGLAGCRGRLGCPRGRYAAAAVAVAGDRHG